MSAMQTQRTTLDEFVGVDSAREPDPEDERGEPECGHMREYVDDQGNCFRCQGGVGRTDEEREAEADLVDGFEPRGLR